jgi:hypothetical protein
MNILTSDDGYVRIYNWDTQKGSAGSYFDAVVQYRINDSTTGVSVLNDISKEPDGTGEARCGEWYTRLVTMQKKNGHPFYLFLSKSIYSDKASEFFIDAYMLSFYTLSPISVFINNTRARSTLSVPFEASAFSERLPEIRVTQDKAKVFVPGVNKIDGVPTGKYDVYVYDGNNFVYDKNLR